MTTITTAPIPEGFVPLAEYLDSDRPTEQFGGDPLPMLAEELLYVRYGLDRADNLRKRSQSSIDLCAHHWGPESGMWGDHEIEAKQEWLAEFTRAHWALEALDSPELGDRLLAAGMAPEQMEALRAEVEQDAYDDAHPFGFEVAEVESYRCAITGQEFTGKAVVLVPRGAYKDGCENVSDLPICFQPEALMTHLADALKLAAQA